MLNATLTLWLWLLHMVISGLISQNSNSDDFRCPFTRRGYFVIRRKMFLMYRQMYCLLKNNNRVEPYVSIIYITQRSLCAQSRSGTISPLLLFFVCELDETENEVNFLLWCPTYGGIRDVLLSGMSSISADFFWLYHSEKNASDCCCASETEHFFQADFVCQALERCQNILFNTELQTKLQFCNETNCNEMFDSCNCTVGVLWTYESWALCGHDMKMTDIKLRKL